MLSAHLTSFLKLIGAQLEETARGVVSSHHVRSVECGIENILSLVEYDDGVVASAERRASIYITRHKECSSETTISAEDADRFRAAQDALSGFCVAIERSRPKARVRMLGL
jgi:hypothetical protein